MKKLTTALMLCLLTVPSMSHASYPKEAEKEIADEMIWQCKKEAELRFPEEDDKRRMNRCLTIAKMQQVYIMGMSEMHLVIKTGKKITFPSSSLLWEHADELWEVIGK